jgi:hypothetical protein
MPQEIPSRLWELRLISKNRASFIKTEPLLWKISLKDYFQNVLKISTSLSFHLFLVVRLRSNSIHEENVKQQSCYASSLIVPVFDSVTYLIPLLYLKILWILSVTIQYQTKNTYTAQLFCPTATIHTPSSVQFLPISLCTCARGVELLLLLPSSWVTKLPRIMTRSETQL